MRKYLVTTIATSVLGLAWRNRHRLFGDRGNTSEQAPAQQAEPPSRTT